MAGPGPLLFHGFPRWQIWAAFGGALAVHGIAVALAFHKEPPPVDVSDTPIATVVATLDEPPADEPTPPPEDIPVPEAPPPPDVQPEFHEEVTPPPKQQKIAPQKAQPIKAPQVSGPPRPPGVMSASAAKAQAISAPRPEYPYEARRRKAMGSGVCVVTVDTSSGSVTDASMAQSIGDSTLDNAATSAFRRWKFKPGTVSKVRIPITYTMTGASY